MTSLITTPLDSRQLRAFVTLARTGSFTRAAQELHLTQSAISHGIRALEEAVGCRIVDRVGKTVLVNQAGERLLQAAEKILAEMAAARADLRQLSQWGRSRLRIGASATACQHILPTVLREFQQKYPTCVIAVEPGDTLEAMELLRQNRIDIAVALESKTEEQFEFRPLFVDELKFVVSPQHRWARAGRVTRSEIPRENFILYQKNSHTFRMVRDYFAEERIELSTIVELGSMEAIKELVKLTLGVSILAPWIAREELARAQLVCLPLGARSLKRRWGIVHWQARRMSLVEETFISLCQAVAARMLSPSRAAASD